MRQLTIHFDVGQHVFGVRQLCLMCEAGEVKVRSLVAPAEEWWVRCPCCDGRGTHPDGPWVVEEFDVYEINFRDGHWIGAPELVYTQMYGDFDQRPYPSDLVFATKEEADAETIRRQELDAKTRSKA